MQIFYDKVLSGLAEKPNLIGFMSSIAFDLEHRVFFVLNWWVYFVYVSQVAGYAVRQQGRSPPCSAMTSH